MGLRSSVQVGGSAHHLEVQIRRDDCHQAKLRRFVLHPPRAHLWSSPTNQMLAETSKSAAAMGERQRLGVEDESGSGQVDGSDIAVLCS